MVNQLSISLSSGSCYDFVVNVGEILDIMNIVPRFQPPMNQVKARLFVAKMTAVVHGATNVHWTFPGSRVVKFTFSLRRVSCRRMGMGFMWAVMGCT